MNGDIDMKDIILNGENDSGGKNVKKILTIIAILVVLFLLVLVIMKFINSGGKIEDESALIIPQDKLLDEKTNKLFKEIPVAKPETKAAEQNVQVVTSQPTTTPPVVTNPEPTQPPTQEIKTVELKPVVEPINEVKTIQNPREVEVKPVEPKRVEVKKETKEEVVKLTTQENKIEPTKVVKKSTKESDTTAKKDKFVEKKAEKKIEKTAEKTVKKEPVAPKQPLKESILIPKNDETPSSNIPLGSYVQVLAASNLKQDISELKKLTSKGYDYKLYKTLVGNKEFVKVLVGPYDSAKLKTALGDIKASINKNAFIYVVK